MTQLWSPLTDEQRQQLVERMEVHTFKQNDVLFRKGEPVNYLMYLLEGKVTVFRQTSDANQHHLVRMVEPGAIFGYHAGFSDEPQEHMAVTGKDTVIAFVPLTLVYHLIWENGAFAMGFIRDLVELLGLSVQYTANMTQKRIRGRLANCLLRMKVKYGTTADGQTLAVYLSRKDLAGMSKMTTSNAIRTLSAFAGEGLVSITGRTIKILDEEGLKRVSDED
jgi:CRP-like cAMP-binding protein